MQHTYDVDTPGFQYPGALDVADVNVYMHPSFMACSHDYSCPVCRKQHAVLNLSKGTMDPCWSCQAEGWELEQVDKRKWWQKLFNLTVDDQ